MFETYQCNTCIEIWSIKAKWEKTKKWKRACTGKRSLGKTSITSKKKKKKNHDEYLSAKLNHLLKNKLKTKWLHLNPRLKLDRELSIERNNSWKLTEYQLHFFLTIRWFWLSRVMKVRWLKRFPQAWEENC